MELMIASTTVRMDKEGRYCLNDLHRAAIEEGKATDSQRPSNFIKSAGIEAFAQVLSEATKRASVVTVKGDAGIYAITNIVTGISYVGSAVRITKRWNLHVHQLRKGVHHSIKLQRAWDKYGCQSFRFHVLERTEDVSLLIGMEQTWIDAFDAYKSGYNATPIAGSRLGHKLDAAGRLKLSIAHLGQSRPHSDATKKKISAAHQGKTLSSEHKEKISLAKSGRGKPKVIRQSRSDGQKVRRLLTPAPKARADNVSGFTGVSQRKGCSKWSARATIAGKLQNLGSFTSPEDAHAAYVTAKMAEVEKRKTELHKIYVTRHSAGLLAEVKRIES